MLLSCCVLLLLALAQASLRAPFVRRLSAHRSARCTLKLCHLLPRAPSRSPPNLIIDERRYIQEYTKLAKALAAGEAVAPGTPPPDLRSKQIELLPGVVVDGHPSGAHFGDVTLAPKSSYVANDTVTVEFQSSNPRSNTRLQGSFLSVERLGSDGKTWSIIATDGDWSTQYAWRRPSKLSDQSIATIRWTPSLTPSDAAARGRGGDGGASLAVASGTYRVHHFGTSRNVFGKLSDFEGVSPSFTYTSA